MATSTSPLFTGTSAFSASLQAAITQAVNIASLPINQLTSNKTTLTNQSDEVSTLNSKFSALQSAINSLDQAVNSSFNTDVSNPAVVSVTAGEGAMQGDYSIQVQDIGAYSTMMTGTWNASPGAAQTYQLWIGSNEFDVNPTDNSAASVAQAINAHYGDKVQATVVNVGSDSQPDYRIALQSTTLTSDAIDLRDSSGTSFESNQSIGRPAQYEVDQSGSIVSSNTRNVTIANGVTVTLLSNSLSPIDVTITRSASAISSALQAFTNAYNAAVDEVNAQRGQSGGALQGQTIVNELSSALGRLATYTGTGAVTSLSALGLDLGSDGHITFNSFTFAAADLMNPNAVSAFLGSATGSGFLQSATNQLNGIEDPGTGLIPSEQMALQKQITSLTSQISAKQAEVNNLQIQLTSQMNTADASIASMEQQYNYVAGMFQAMQTAEQSYRSG